PGLPTHVGVGDVTVAVAEPLRGGILRPQPVRSAKIRNTGSGRQARPGQRRHPTGVREQLTSSLPLDRRVRAAFCHASTLPCLGRTWCLTSKPHRIVRYTLAVGVGTASSHAPCRASAVAALRRNTADSQRLDEVPGLYPATVEDATVQTCCVDQRF